MSNNWGKEPRFHFSHEGNHLSIYLGSIDPLPYTNTLGIVALNHVLKICPTWGLSTCWATRRRRRRARRRTPAATCPVSTPSRRSSGWWGSAGKLWLVEASHVTALLTSDWLAGPGAGSSRTRACSWAAAWPAPTQASSPGRKCYLASLCNMIRDATSKIVFAILTAQC